MSTVAGDDRPSVSEAAAGFDVVTREVEALAVEPPAPLRLAAPVPPGDPRLARAFAASGAATLIVLAAINGTDYAVSAALAVLAPDVERTLHLSDTGFLTTVSLTGLFFALAALPVGIVSDRVSRPKVTGYLTVIAGLATLATAGVRTGAQLGFARVATGAAQSGIQVTHLPLLADTYPVAARQRVYAIHSLMPNVAVVIGPLVAGPMAALIGGSAGWRWPFVLLAGISVTLGLLAIRLAEPGRGASERDDGDQPLVLERASLGPSLARLLRIRSLTGLLTALTVLGGVLIAVPSLLSLYLERVHHLGASGRGLVSAIVGLGAMAGLLAGARVGERLLSEHPQRVARLVALALCVYAVLLSGALRLHSLTAVTVGATVASFFGQLGIVPLYVIITGIVPPRLRSLSFALVGLAVVVGGGLIGSVAGGALSDDHGTVFALTAVLLGSTPIAAAVIFRSSAFLAEDLRAALEPPVVDEPRELLSLRRVSVSLGSQRVLHEIDLDVRRGEVVALLGTNGAGKSTLLRAISGLIPLDSGSISLDGGELAQATTAARVAAGLVQMPGGRALFPELSVRENLLAGTHTYAWDAQRVSRETLRVLEIFPILSTRLRQPAGSLSGGEQQLLGLAKALLLSPRLLMIDELTLGLSPVAVDQVLTVVSRLRAEGVSMLIVEQSISLATRIADRAIFLERGRVRFDGPPSELLARGDLARAVFLGADGG